MMQIRVFLLPVVASLALGACAALPHRLDGGSGPAAPDASPAAAAPHATIPSPPSRHRLVPLPELPQLPPQSSAARRDTDTDLPALPELPAHGADADRARQAVRQPSPQRRPPASKTADDDSRQRARTALDDLDNRVNLDDAQVQRLKRAHAALVEGNSRLAAKLAVGLDAEVRSSVRHHRVRRGETLGAIAQAIYGNSDLWPLIWRANRKIVPTPAGLRSGTVLSIHPYPTIDEVASALAYVHHHAY